MSATRSHTLLFGESLLRIAQIAGGTMAGVQLKGIRTEYDGVVAEESFDLEIKDKEFVVLLGPSGCGKTTTLRCIAGLEDVDGGEIYIGDRLVNDLDPKERNIAMVFQSYALYPHMTVYGNIAFPLENARVSEREINERVNRTARLLQIEPLLGRKPVQLSGGQRQRVALGRAIVREPTVFLMDEPLSNRDAQLRFHMRAELKKLQKDLGITTIYVTHDQVEAMTMGDRIAILNHGELQQYDTPRRVYVHPSNHFVAGFVGSPPTTSSECTRTKGGVLDAGEFQLAVPYHLQSGVENAVSEELLIGVRPQDVEVLRDSTDRPDCIAAQVYTTEPQGDITILDLTIGDRLVKAVVGIAFDAEGLSGLSVRFRPERILLFDRKTGKAIG